MKTVKDSLRATGPNAIRKSLDYSVKRKSKIIDFQRLGDRCGSSAAVPALAAECRVVPASGRIAARRGTAAGSQEPPLALQKKIGRQQSRG